MKCGKILSLAVCAALLTVPLAGCGNQNAGNEGGKVTLSVSNYPPESNPEKREVFDKKMADFETLHPDIDIVGDQYVYAVDSFVTKAAAGQQPTLCMVYFSEIQKVINSGFAMDITDYVTARGYDQHMNDQIKNMVSKDGKIFAMPYEANFMGLLLNLKLFQDAGLVNEDGSVQIPETYEDIAQMGQQITEKTGKAGFALPTINNNGGWYFMNVAWSFGTEFMAQEDGKWVAKFDSPECVAALQYIKDLKWKYNTLPADSLKGVDDLRDTLMQDQSAMMFVAGMNVVNGGVLRFAKDRNELSVVAMPAGPAGRYSLMGGNVYILKPNTPKEQVEAAMDWLEFCGYTPVVTDAVKENLANSFKADSEKGSIIAVPGLQVWDTPEMNQAVEEAMAPYVNVDRKLYEGWNNTDQVQLHMEEPVKCQELYKVMDAMLQEVLTNENADVQALVSQAAQDFQTNYLDSAN